MDTYYTFEQKLFILKDVYRLIINAIDSIEAQHFFYVSDELETCYEELKNVMFGILDDKNFSRWQTDELLQYDSLNEDSLKIETTWPEYRVRLLRSVEQIESEWLSLGRNEYKFSPQSRALLNAMNHAIETNKLIVEAKQSADKFVAHISIDGFSRPVVEIDNEFYFFTSMREDGNASQIFNFCLEHYPNQEVKSSQLKSELGINTSNLKSTFQKSLFDKGKPLSRFVQISPHAVKVSSVVILSKEEFAKLKSQSTEN